MMRVSKWLVWLAMMSAGVRSWEKWSSPSTCSGQQKRRICRVTTRCRARRRKLLAQRLFATADQAVDIANAKLPQASASQAAVVGGISIQRALELLNQGTPQVQINVAQFEKSLEMSEAIDEAIRYKKAEAAAKTVTEEMDDPEEDTSQAESGSES